MIDEAKVKACADELEGGGNKCVETVDGLRLLQRLLNKYGAEIVAEVVGDDWE